MAAPYENLIGLTKHPYNHSIKISENFDMGSLSYSITKSLLINLIVRAKALEATVLGLISWAALPNVTHLYYIGCIYIKV